MDTSVRETLIKAGWWVGRRQDAVVEKWRNQLDTPGGFQMTLSAQRALAEFGGIRVDTCGAGKEFCKGSFWLDPTLAVGEEDRFAKCIQATGTQLYPLGEAYDGNAFLGIDEHGAVYLVTDEARYLAPSIEQALEVLIVGGGIR